ncbi:MAG: class I SAM-dependent methyltransferase [Acetilactobacillus jinshanensis]
MAYTLRKYSWVQTIIQHLDLRTAAKILDMGTGKGYFLTHVTKAAGPVAYVTGIEGKNQYTIHKARKNAKMEHVNNRVNVIHGDVRHLPFPNDSFNLITAMDTKNSFMEDHDAEDVKQIYREIVRVLKQYGSFVLVSNQKNVNRIYKYLNTLDGVEVQRSHNTSKFDLLHWGKLTLRKEA